MAPFRFRSRRQRRRTIFATTAVLASALLFFQTAAFAVLSGSPSQFESNDGNMVVDGGAGFHDWANVTFDHVTDVASSQSDDSFVSGQKQDTVCPDTYLHGNPPKDDFTDVASYTETNTNTGDTYLYGATIRYTANGNASENVELKQGLSGLCPGSTTLLARTPGDKLIAIDYLNGGTNVDFHVLTWVGTGACFVGNDTAPCWGEDVLTLSAAGAEGLASQSPITALNNAISHVALVAGRFAEFGVNLATAGIIPSGTCKAFPQTVWESRAAGSSFVATTKDIAIENKTIANCGQVIIRKVTDPSPDANDTSFGFAATGGLSPASFSLKDGQKQDYGAEVPQGSYGVSETPDANYTLSNIDCSASDLGHGSSVTIGASGGFDAGDTSVSMSLNPSDVIDCTFTNTLKTGAIKILKESTKAGNPLVQNAGAVFSYDGNSVTDNGTGDEDSTVGSVCVSGLGIGDYTVNETSPPTGYGDASQSDLTATATAGTNCTDNLPTGTGVVTFTNPPLADIQVRFRDGGSGETSLAEAISCTNTTGASNPADTAEWDDTLTVTGVHADATTVTITCTIKIDP